MNSGKVEGRKGLGRDGSALKGALQGACENPTPSEVSGKTLTARLGKGFSTVGFNKELSP